MSKITLAAAFSLAATAIASSDAEAAPIAASGVTTVEVTAPIGALGLGALPIGTATVDTSGTNPELSFPITGGSANGALLIEHEGSGVELFAIADPTISATVGDFLIDTGAGTVSGDVNGAPFGVLFNLGSATSGGIPLLISGGLADGLTSVFGAPDLEGVEFGLANTAPQVVPVPAALPLLAGGLGLMGVVGARRRRS